jgi:hypothetical protein
MFSLYVSAFGRLPYIHNHPQIAQLVASLSTCIAGKEKFVSNRYRNFLAPGNVELERLNSKARGDRQNRDFRMSNQKNV